MKTTVLLVFFLILSIGTVFASQVNNGTFDSGLSGWDVALLQPIIDSDGNIQPKYVADSWGAISVDNGTAKLQILDYGLNVTTITLSQALTLSSTTANISFDVKFDNGTPRDLGDAAVGEPNFFQASFLSDTDYQVLLGYDVVGPYDPYSFENLTDTGSNVWYHFSGNITGNGTLYFDLQDMGDAFYSTAWVDNVVLTENVTQVPEPSIIFLLSASIAGFLSAGFISIRRSKV